MKKAIEINISVELSSFDKRVYYFSLKYLSLDYIFVFTFYLLYIKKNLNPCKFTALTGIEFFTFDL